MIGKKEWFTTRRYYGWGLRPITWQGWVYIFVILAVVLSIEYGPFWADDQSTRLGLLYGWVALAIADTVHIWVSLKGK